MILFALLALLGPTGDPLYVDPVSASCGALEGAARESCAVNELSKLDAQLSDVFQEVLKYVTELDKLTANYPKPWRYTEAVRDAQETWQAYRDAECRMEAYPLADSVGKPEPVAEYSCRAKMTIERTTMLRDSLKDQNVQ